MDDKKRTTARKVSQEASHTRLNVRRESRRLTNSPLDPLWRRLSPKTPNALFWADEIGRSFQAYDFYRLSIQRFYEELSLGARWRSGPYYTRKYRRPYTPYERKLMDRFRPAAQYLELDFFNCLLHARILMDRTIALARRFLPRPGSSPSFTSFSDHKKFFERHPDWHPAFRDYVDYIRNETGWFDELKEIRDKALVHQGPPHSRFFGYPFDRTDLELLIHFPIDERLLLGLGEPRVLSVRTLAANVETFLWWFSRRALRTLRDQPCQADIPR